VKKQILNGYFAGGLFSNKDLAGNALLAQKIFEISEETFLPILPQNLEQREANGASIRNNDLLALTRADWAIFHFDGTELDSGTVVEHELAQTLDIPSLLIRSDFRAGGDFADLPWNLMIRPGPRGKVIVFNSMTLYQSALSGPKGDSSLGIEKTINLISQGLVAAEKMHASMATEIVNGLKDICSRKPILNLEQFKIQLELKAISIGDNFDKYLNNSTIAEIISRRALINSEIFSNI
jgi:nucleoside 2-deoxyribosyltransferase